MSILMVLLTLAISVWNSYAVGSALPYARSQGGMFKLVTIAGGVMTGIGFTMVMAVIIMGVGGSMHMIPPHVMHAFSKIMPALIIIPLVLAGSIITIQSWRAVFVSGQSGLERAGNIAGAAWNTYAMAENAMSLPGILKGAFSSDGDDEDSRGYALMIAIMALLSGFAIAYFMIEFFARREVRKMSGQMGFSRG